MSVSEKHLWIRVGGSIDPSFEAAQKKAESSINKINSVAKTVAMIGGTAVAASVAGAIKVGSSFEEQMSTVKAISGASISEMGKLTQKAQEMGETTKYTATESGKAMEYMAMAGWKTDDMLNGISGIMNLAAASGEELASVSDIVTDALTAFKLGAEDSAHFSDILAAASSNSNTNVGMIGETFKYVAPVADSLGYSVEDTAISIGLLANSGIKASRAGNSLRKIMASTTGGVVLYGKAFAKAGEKMGKFKISSRNADGSMKEWSAILDKLRIGFGKLSEGEQADNAKRLVGLTGMSALTTLVNASEKDYKKLTKSINNAAGATQKMADIKLDNLKGDTDLFKSVLESKGIDLYKELKEPLRDAVQTATEFLEDVDVDRVGDVLVEAGKGVASFAEPLMAVGDWMMDNPDVIADTIEGIGKTIVAYKVVDGLKNMAIGIKSIATVMNPYVAVFGGATAACIGLYTYIDNVKERGIAESLSNQFGDISLSLEEIEAVASYIVGSEKLEEVSNLLQSIKVSDDLEESLGKLKNDIGKVEYMAGIGIDINPDGLESFNTDVKSYVDKTKEHIEQRGYTIKVATDVLFDDSPKGEEMLSNTNKFYLDLENQTNTISGKINKVLKRAMKEGLTIDIQDELDSLLGELNRINSALSNAESEAKWQSLEQDFSGISLTTESFDDLSNKIKENMDDIKEGADSARVEALKNTNAKYELGYISKAEYENERKDIENARDNTIEKSRKRGGNFVYNTIMDAYAEKLSKKAMTKEDEDAMQKLIEKAQETGFLSDEQDEIFSDIDYSFSIPKWSKNISDAAYRRKIENGKSYAYKTWSERDNKIVGTAREYLDEKNVFSKKTEQGIANAAKTQGTEAFKSIQKQFSKEASNGISANVPINISGSYSVASNQSKKQNITSNPYTIPIPGHADGIISNKQHMAVVSEGNKKEAIIPIDGSSRSRRLYEQTGSLLGIGTTQSTGTFAPVIHIHMNGYARKENANEAAEIIEKKLTAMYKKMQRDNARYSMR